MPHYPCHVTESIEKALLTISPATIDRLLAKSRFRYNKRGLATTKPGSIIKKRIPIKTNQWDETRPGFLEADTVAHCGDSVAGTFVFTINCVDIATGWTEQRATWGKGERATVDSIKSIEESLPFNLLGFDCDNGSEFLNWHLVRYLTNRKKPVNFTRSRAYHKNDNAHIEQKNWTDIRQYLGYDRFDNPRLVDLVNNLYTTEWKLYFNFFIPSMKLIAKKRIGAKTEKIYDKAKTPFQRITESNNVNNKIKQDLQKQYKNLDPFHLQKIMSQKIRNIINIANEPVIKNVDKKGVIHSY
ncbi:integrase [Calditrichota bacterium]